MYNNALFKDPITMPKEKVTFTIDANVIEKARELNVNLSQITETVLRSFAYRAKPASKKQVYAGYRLLFELLTPLLMEYDCDLVVGTILAPPNEDPILSITIVLTPDGTLQEIDYEGLTSPIKNLESISTRHLLSPLDILKKLVDTLYDASQEQERILEELELAKRIILAIQPSILKSRSRQMTEESGKSGKPV
jgi:hypothetical protein